MQPSLVFVNFGMNDGGYKAYDEATFRNYLAAQGALADTIRAAGAREVLFTTSPVDDVLRKDNGVYNDTLSRMARGLGQLAAERGLPLIDLLHPMLEVQRRAKEKDPAFTMIPDTVHPDAVGHLVMAYAAIRQIDAPRAVGDIVVDGELGRAQGATIGNAVAKDGGVEFDLTLPFLPFYVPKEARRALDLVPLEDELNRFRLQVKGRPGSRASRPLGRREDGGCLHEGRAGPRRRSGAPRRRAVGRGGAHAVGSGAVPLAEALRGLAGHGAAEAGLHDARPRHVRAVRSARSARTRTSSAARWERSPGPEPTTSPCGRRASVVAIRSLELSPTYPLVSFDAPQPPEENPASVTWTPAPFVDGQIDLGAHYSGAYDVVAYARLVLQADQATTLHLAMGSDDGLAVFLGGKRVFAHDVLRGLKKGEDEVEVPLVAGRNELLFKVTQAGGDFGLAVDARVRGLGKVEQIAPR